MSTPIRWIARTVMMLALIYGFFVLGTALWLRQHLTVGNLSASGGCWGQGDSMARAASTPWRRDRLILYLLRTSPTAPESRGPGANLKLIPAEYVYLTWWPTTERDRLFAATAPNLRSCRSPVRP